MLKETKSYLFSVTKAKKKIQQVLLYNRQQNKKLMMRRRIVCSLTQALTYNSPRRESKFLFHVF